MFVLVLIVVWSINPEFELKWGWPLLMTVYLGVYLGVPSALVGAFFGGLRHYRKHPTASSLRGLITTIVAVALAAIFVFLTIDDWLKMFA